VLQITKSSQPHPLPDKGQQWPFKTPQSTSVIILWAKLQRTNLLTALYHPFQNTALHLAAIHGHPDVVSCLLSSEKQEILMNKKNQNVLDAAIETGMRNALLAIASHER